MSTLKKTTPFKNVFTYGGLHFSPDAHLPEKLIFHTQNLPPDVFEMQFKQIRYPRVRALTLEFSRLGAATGIRDVLTLCNEQNLINTKIEANRYCLQMLNQVAIDNPEGFATLFGDPIAIPFLSTGVVDDEQILLILRCGNSREAPWSLDYLKAGKVLPADCQIANLYLPS